MHSDEMHDYLSEEVYQGLRHPPMLYLHNFSDCNYFIQLEKCRLRINI